MKHSLTLLTAAVVLFMTSCNNQPKPAEQAATVVAKKGPQSLPPYKSMLVQHSVKDYDAWLKEFNSTDSIRKGYGLTQSAVGRGIEDDKMLVVYNVATDIQKAKDFGASPGLKAAMEKAGVTSAPVISYLDVSFDDTSAIAQTERLMVSHHVKDYDTWKKAFDAEGDSARAANGLVERLLARGVDDANTVTILFAVTDMAKAKARVASPELKKVMTDAGVDSEPQLTWFKWTVMNN